MNPRNDAAHDISNTYDAKTESKTNMNFKAKVVRTKGAIHSVKRE